MARHLDIRLSTHPGERTPLLPDLRLHADLIDPIAFEHFLRHTPAGRDLHVIARGEGGGPGAAAHSRATRPARALGDASEPRRAGGRGVAPTSAPGPRGGNALGRG
jgi:hypothetical protein